VTPRIIIRPQASQELDDLAEHLAQSSVAAARRLLEAAEQTFPKLAQMPGIGSPCQLLNPRLQDLRCWPITGFKNYLIFYRPLDDGIEVLHVLYGTRDIPSLLERESG
jgi:toxin ParE1/3/4